MSERYNLILGQELTCLEPVRRKYYRWMLVYLVFAGMLLAEGAYQISKRIKEVRGACQLTASFTDVKPSEEMNSLIKLGEKQEALLKILSSSETESIPFIPVLFEIKSSLPSGVEIESMEMSDKELLLVLRVSVRSGVSPETYPAQWRRNKALNNYLEPFDLVSRDNIVDDNDNEKYVEISCKAAIKNR